MKSSTRKLLASIHVAYGAINTLLLIYSLQILFQVFPNIMRFDLLHYTGEPDLIIPFIICWIMVGGFFGVLILLSLAAFLSAYYIRRNEKRDLCLIISGLNIFNVPFGPVLGIITIITLGKPNKVMHPSAHALADH